MLFTLHAYFRNRKAKISFVLLLIFTIVCLFRVPSWYPAGGSVVNGVSGTEALTQSLSNQRMPLLVNSRMPPLPDDIIIDKLLVDKFFACRPVRVGETLHNLRTFVIKEEKGFSCLHGFSKDKAIKSIVNYECAKDSFDGRIPFAESRYGLRYIYSKSAHSAAQAHPGHVLSILAESGLSLDYPLITPSGTKAVEDVLADAVSMFQIDGEIEWLSVGFAAYLSPKTEWKNRFGTVFSFDQVVAALIFPERTNFACGGSHRLYSLAFIRQVDEQQPILSDSARVTLNHFLRNAVNEARQSQRANGSIYGFDYRLLIDSSIESWGLNNFPAMVHKWRDMSQLDRESALTRSRAVTDLDFIILTGHHLEWIALLPSTWQPEESWWQASYQFLYQVIQQAEGNNICMNYCPYSHAMRVLLIAEATRCH